MALRLFLVSVVATLALDLPNAGPTSPRSRGASIAPVLIATASPTTAPMPVVVVVATPTTTDGPTADPVKTDAPLVTIRPIAPIAPTLPVAPAVVVVDAPKPEAPAVVAAPAPAVVVDAPKPEAPAVVESPKPEPDAPAPMPAPEAAPEIALTPSPAADAAIAPVPSVAATDPMAAPEADVEIVVAAPAPVIVEAPKPTDPDLAFRTIVRKMAKEFAADIPAPATSAEPKPLLAIVDAPIPTAPEAAPAPPPADEVAAADEADLYPGVAFALNRSAEGLAPILSEVAARAEPEPASAPAVAEPSNDPSRAERLANAVKLTGQAMNAWAGLLSQRAGAASLQR